MTALHTNLNRAIHLARRDAFYERAVELLCIPSQEMDLQARIQQINKVMALLKTASKHAFFAVRSPRAAPKEHDFLHFLGLIADNVQSIHSMLLHQAHLEAAESFLCQFLNASAEQAILPALHYRRRADDLMQGLWQMLRYAQSPYRALQVQIAEAMSPDDKARYDKAYASFREEANSRFRMPEALNGVPARG